MHTSGATAIAGTSISGSGEHHSRVLLYSGGLDSFIASRLLNASYRRVYIPVGSRYSSKERSWIDAAWVLNDMLKVTKLERSDGFVPQRNVMLVTLAQAFADADEVVLCGVRGEYSRDKHPRFYRDMSRLLSYTAGKPVKVWSPFERMTKSEAVAEYLRQGYQPSDLLQLTVSCYDPEARACGRCMSCFRRWVALENNGLAQFEHWDAPPWQATKFKSPGVLRSLPPGMWLDFAMAQRDVVKAYYNVWKRGALRAS